jgi:hypothetical protein
MRALSWVLQSFDSPREGQARSHPVAHKDTERLWH